MLAIAVRVRQVSRDLQNGPEFSVTLALRIGNSVYLFFVFTCLHPIIGS
jgi:hypothetical protein